MTWGKLSSNYVANIDIIIGQFVHPVGGYGMKWMGDRYFSQLQVSLY